MASLRLLVADDVGHLKCLCGGAESLEVVSKWGQAGVRRGLVECSSMAEVAERKVVAVARECGTVEIFDCSSGSELLAFRAREGCAPGSAPPRSSPLDSVASLAWCRGEGVGVLPGPFVSVSRDGLLCIRKIQERRNPASDERSEAEDLAAFKTPNLQKIKNTDEVCEKEQEPGDAEEGLVGRGPVLQQNLAASFSVLDCSGGGGPATEGKMGAGAVRADAKRLFVECSDLGLDGATIAVGGKGVEPSVWDLQTATCTWHAKNPKPNFLGIVEEKWVTSLCHVSPPSSRVIAAGTSSGRIHLFDPSAQRRPVASWEAGESPIRRLVPAGADVAEGSLLVFGSKDGVLGLADVRKGRLVGLLKGGAGGSVRALAVHPSKPILASYGLDRYLRVHDLQTRDLKSQVYLKEAGTGIVFLDCFPTKEEDGDEEGNLPQHRTAPREGASDLPAPAEKTTVGKQKRANDNAAKKKSRPANDLGS